MFDVKWGRSGIVAKFHGTSKTNRNTVDKENIQVLARKDKWIENVEDLDHSFTKKDFLRVIVSSIWQSDHRRFIPGLLKAIMTLALQLYLGIFLPEPGLELLYRPMRIETKGALDIR